MERDDRGVLERESHRESVHVAHERVRERRRLENRAAFVAKRRPGRDDLLLRGLHVEQEAHRGEALALAHDVHRGS